MYSSTEPFISLKPVHESMLLGIEEKKYFNGRQDRCSPVPARKPTLFDAMTDLIHVLLFLSPKLLLDGQRNKQLLAASLDSWSNTVKSDE